MTRALVTGVGGQDGVLLARHLLRLGHEVVGTTRPGEEPRLAPYLDGVVLRELDVRDTAQFARLVGEFAPAEIYQLAGRTSVADSWQNAELVTEVNAASVERMLEALLELADPPRFFQASSAQVLEVEPLNPYAQSKARAQAAVAAARDKGLFAVCGVLHNHESPLRPPSFVSRKITLAAAQIAAGRRDSVELGNVHASRDWGAAADYVVAMQLMLAADLPADQVLATGRVHSISDLLEAAFGAVGVGDPWSHVVQQADLLRPTDPPGKPGEVDVAAAALGWRAVTGFQDMVRAMVAVDVERVATGVEESPAYLGSLG